MSCRAGDWACGRPYIGELHALRPLVAVSASPPLCHCCSVLPTACSSPGAAPVTAVAASTCGSLALTGDAGGSVKLWDLADGSLLGTAAASAPETAMAAACFSADGAVATLQERSSVVQVWSTSGSRLSLAGELDAAGSGGSCTVTALAASGPLLALGCSDGSTQLWRQSGSEFEPHSRVPAPCSVTAPICCLALSSADPAVALVAVAAGPALAVVDASDGTLLAERQLAAAPAALYWCSSGELHALLLDSCRLQRLGAPKPAAGASVQPTATAVAAASPRKKAVRFADQQCHSSAASEAGAGKAREAGCPQPCHASSSPASLAAAVPLPALSARSSLPPLPSHPLLRGSSAGAARPASIWAHSSSDSGTAGSSSSSGGSSGVPVAASMTHRPTYPVLDLRALQGLRPCAAKVGGSAAMPVSGAASSSVSPLGSALGRQAADKRQAAGVSSELHSPLPRVAAPAAVPAAGTSPASSVQHTHTPVEAALPSAAACSGQEQATEFSCSEQAAAQALSKQPAGDDGTPQPRSLPPPLQQCRPPPSGPAGVSKQRCDACAVLAEAPAPGSRPVSPAKAELLAQLSQLAREPAVSLQSAQAADGASGSSSRPVSPVKPGVLCTRQAQLAGELLPAEVRPFTGAGRQVIKGWALHHGLAARLCRAAAAVALRCMHTIVSRTTHALQLRSMTPRWRILSSVSSAMLASAAAALPDGSRELPLHHLQLYRPVWCRSLQLRLAQQQARARKQRPMEQRRSTVRQGSGKGRCRHCQLPQCRLQRHRRPLPRSRQRDEHRQMRLSQQHRAAKQMPAAQRRRQRVKRHGQRCFQTLLGQLPHLQQSARPRRQQQQRISGRSCRAAALQWPATTS